MNIVGMIMQYIEFLLLSLLCLKKPFAVFYMIDFWIFSTLDKVL